jgi:predicted  nucleic acid-binding Zn-ribbon protein
MDPQFLAPLIPVVAIIAFAAVRIARIRTTRTEVPSAEVTARLEALEGDVHGLHQELAETQERLDFAERLLTKAAEERRIGS